MLFSARRSSPTPTSPSLQANLEHPTDVVRQHGLSLLLHCTLEIITLGTEQAFEPGRADHTDQSRVIVYAR